jgi:hypothetical protein
VLTVDVWLSRTEVPNSVKRLLVNKPTRIVDET